MRAGMMRKRNRQRIVDGLVLRVEVEDGRYAVFQVDFTSIKTV